MRFSILSLIFIVPTVLFSQETNPLSQILNSGDEAFRNTLHNANYEVQIIYGEINESAKEIKHYYFQYDPESHFYPASTVKMPVAFATIQKINEEKLELSDSLIIEPSPHNFRTFRYDSLFKKQILFQNLIKKIFTYSDNQAYNILYGFLGKDYINNLNKELGLNSSKIVHQLSESAFQFSTESNNYTFKLRVLGKKKDKYSQESELNLFDSKSELKNQVKGRGYINGDGKLVEQPFDFTHKNHMNLKDLIGSLERVIMPHAFSSNQRYNFSKDDYDLLNRAMLMRPRELPVPKDSLPDNYAKYFIYGDSKSRTYPDRMQIKNKIGEAYGYLTDIAYIRDKLKGVQFFLAASIHVNKNGIYNDGEYEYREVGVPFLAELGRLVYQYELNKKD